MEDFRKAGEAKEPLVKDEKWLFGAKASSFWRNGKWQEWKIRGLYHEDDLISVDQKIPNWLIKVTFLGKVKTTIRFGVKSRSGIMVFSTGDIILGLRVFLFNNPPF